MVWLSSFCPLRGAPPPRLPPLAHSLAALVTSPLLLAEHFGVSKPHTACRLAPSALVTSPLLLAEHFGVSKPRTACRRSLIRSGRWLQTLCCWRHAQSVE